MTDKTMTEIVEKILKTDARARKDAAWLVYSVWRHYTNIFIPFEDFKKLPSPEAIVRMRRVFQNIQNKYNVDEFVKEEGITYYPPEKTQP